MIFLKVITYILSSLMYASAFSLLLMITPIFFNLIGVGIPNNSMLAIQRDYYFRPQ